MTAKTARETILASLRASLGSGRDVFRAAPASADPAVPPSPVTSLDGAAPDALARRFAEELHALQGTCRIVDGSEAARAAVSECVSTWLDSAGGPREILSWAPEHLSLPGIAAALGDAGAALYVPTDLHDAEQRAKAAGLSVGITGADAAFATTGTLALLPAEGKSRAASLLPSYHLVILPASRIYPTVESWFAALRAAGELPDRLRDVSQVTFVSGPSKSADIELNLTLGVHGPREVRVVVWLDGEF